MRRWAVKLPNEWWVHRSPLLWSCAQVHKSNRTLFTSLKLARAVALVTGGRVYRVKS